MMLVTFLDRQRKCAAIGIERPSESVQKEAASVKETSGGSARAKLRRRNTETE
ncbi:hypothetical protein [Sphingopyxis sp. Geo24]|jgi:hypothetical protein|uniref:hypothetical protein n=1 Tax=Sphingopyxis sp. Geo24 TaxID=340058 RepID=UPI0024AD1CC2|nr:hypothetical protein [Sphingopyxis sp. Geo24]